MNDKSPVRPVSYAGLEGLSWISRSELDFLTERLPERGLFIEVGTASGVSAAIVADRRPELRVLCVDIFADHDAEHAEPNRIENWRRNRRPNMHLWVGTAADLGNTFPRIRANAVLVDAGHVYDEVARDLMSGLGLLADAGTLFVHDYDEPNLPDVRRAVDDFKRAWRFAVTDEHCTMLAMKWLGP